MRYDEAMIANIAAVVNSQHAGQQTRPSTLSPGQFSRPGGATRFLNDEARWRAVLERDAGHDGRFYYAVSSTGVYCLPSCPSRRPRRGGVRFFETAAEAEKAGFRACFRCRPLERNRQVVLIERLCR